MFTVTSFDWGSKYCAQNVVAVHPDFEEFRMCADGLDRYPRLGGTIEVRGLASGWGIVRERVTVR